MTIKVAFVHTPMAAATVPERQLFWRNFDIQYHAAHPGLRHMKEPMWELPHWMHWLAGEVLKAGFDSVEVVDLAWSATGLATLDESLVAGIVREHEADVYLFSPMTPNLPLSLGIAGMVKEVNPDAKVVFGGVVATPLSRELAADPRVDFVVSGRGEVALPALLRALEGEAELASVGNLSFKSEDGRVHSTGWQYPATAPRDIAEPKIDLFPAETGENIRYLRQVYALGCPYDCSFCTIQTIRQKQSYFPVERVLREIEGYRAQYGVHHNIYFGDETFGLNKANTLELYDALEADGTIKYDCQTRLRCLADAETRERLRRSGCLWVEVGLETKSQSTQDKFKQRQKVEEVEDILTRTRDDGLAACAFMVNGFPDQTLDDMKESVDWVCDLISRRLLRASYFATLVPYPGSGLYTHPERFGVTIHHHRYQYYNEDLPPVFDSGFARSDEIYRVFLDGLKMIGQATGETACVQPTNAEESHAEFGRFWATSHI